jgi:hypothetical protein
MGLGPRKALQIASIMFELLETARALSIKPLTIPANRDALPLIST